MMFTKYFLHLINMCRILIYNICYYIIFIKIKFINFTEQATVEQHFKYHQ